MIRDLCHELYLPVGLTDRKNVYIVYLKESEAILELLALIGVEESLLQAFESARNLKEIRNQVNRLVNCETANLQRTINAAMKQIENINLLIKYDEYDELPKVLKQTANLRLNNPEASLTELAELLNCSRSAINHRMRKIDALAMQIRKDNSIKEMNLKKIALSIILLFVIFMGGVIASVYIYPPKGVMIFEYHRVNDDTVDTDDYSLSRNNFKNNWIILRKIITIQFQ